MQYTFENRDYIEQKIILVMTLDRKKKTERILVGQEELIRVALKFDNAIPVFCDVTRPLGSVLFDEEYNNAQEWYDNTIYPIYTFPTMSDFSNNQYEKYLADYLNYKCQSNNPVSMYLAFHIWNEYMKLKQIKGDTTTYVYAMKNKMDGLFAEYYLSFTPKIQDIFHHPSALDVYEQSKLKHGDTARLELWMPNKHFSNECVVADNTLKPLITYYQNRLDDWHLYVKTCKVCGKKFLADSQRYELCSDKCRKAQSLQNKRDFDDRARKNNYDLVYKNECQNWRNKINKAIKSGTYSPEQIDKMKQLFSDFKKEALYKKKQVKTKEITAKEFTDWIYSQSNDILTLIN